MNEICRHATNHRGRDPEADEEDEAWEARSGRFVAGRDTLELRASAGHLYAMANRLAIPVNVMFFPQDGDHFTAFDPATGAVTRLEFSGARGESLAFASADGRGVSAQRTNR
jgi:hypothetical protein